MTEQWDEREGAAQSVLKSTSSPRPPLSQALDAMKFDPENLRDFVCDNNAVKKEASYRAGVHKELDEKDITIAAYKVRQCGIPVGIRGIGLLLDGKTDGVTEFHRVWRYLAYDCHVRLRYGDWIRNQIDEGVTPEFEVPSLIMDVAAYALAGAIFFGEVDYAEWLGKRAVAAFMQPEVFGPALWQKEPVVPYVLGLFWYWTAMRCGEEPKGFRQIIDKLSKDCAKPYYGRLLIDWNERAFDRHFKKMCDNWGGTDTRERSPFQGFPVAILATLLIRKQSDLSIPEHPLLAHSVCTLPLAGCDGSTDPFFDQVNEKLAEIAPTEELLWRW